MRAHAYDTQATIGGQNQLESDSADNPWSSSLLSHLIFPFVHGMTHAGSSVFSPLVLSLWLFGKTFPGGNKGT